MTGLEIIEMVLAVIFSYLLGSVPSGYIIVKKATGNDIRNMGSGNIGATNTVRVAGKKGGIIVLLFDLLKGVIPTLIGYYIGGMNFAFVCGICALLGHIFPVWLKFKGGKGAATAIGVMFVVSPLSALITILAWLLTLLITRIVSLSTIVATVVLDIAVLILHYDIYYSLPVLFASVLVIYRHKDNIKRLLNGTEYRFDRKVSK